MLADRYDLPLSTASTAARDAFVAGSVLALTFYPGAAEAFDRALAADPAFAMAHAAKAQVLMRQGDVGAAREALAAARGLAAGLAAREASHINVFDLAFAGRTDAAIASARDHLAAWPRDALVVATVGNPNGLIGASGRLGQKHEIAMLMDALAPHYGDDYWFLSYHAMALSEDGQLAAARQKIERSIALNPNNAHGAHGFAHIYYESGESDLARGWLSSWLEAYPRDGFFHGHLNWHLSLCELQAGELEKASRVFRDAIALDRHSGGPQQKISDGAAYLWRSELAGRERNRTAWRALYEYTKGALPRPGSGLADLHVILAQTVMGDDAALEDRARTMEEMSGEGRYPSGSYLPALMRGFTAFERGDFAAAIAAFTPLVGQTERIGGSRAQHDLIAFTHLKACLNAGRSNDVQDLLAARHRGGARVPVQGVKLAD
jgi:hypothetical protein